MAGGVGGYTLDLIPMIQDMGIDRETAALIQATMGIAVIVGRLSVGALMDYFFLRRASQL